MPNPVRSVGERLPNGWIDLIRQFALFWVVYQCYQVVRGISEGRQEIAFANAERIIDIEKATGTFFELNLQAALLDHQWIVDFANFMYVNSHFTVTTLFLAWLYLFRNEHFYFVRNMFMVAMGLALIGYATYPTAPPRMFGELGFVDTIDVFTPIQQDSNSVSLLVNSYAAVPSMHIGFAAMVGGTVFFLARSRAVKVAAASYPLMVLFVVVMTANHYWLDALAGAIVAALSALTAKRLLAPQRPEDWGFGPAPARQATT